MERVEAIRCSRLFGECMGRIDEAEADRAFCGHDLRHLLDVARIAWALNLERGCGLDRDLVYAAALLHDLGRAEQYRTGEDHDVAGVRIAGQILDGLPAPVTFDARERAAILAAVGGHRGDLRDERSPGDPGPLGAAVPAPSGMAHVLARLIKEADGRSRACYACAARDACYWPDERKNLSIDI